MTEMESNLYCKIVPITYFVLCTPSEEKKKKRELSSKKEENVYLSHKFETENDLIITYHLNTAMADYCNRSADKRALKQSEKHRKGYLGRTLKDHRSHLSASHRTIPKNHSMCLELC